MKPVKLSKFVVAIFLCAITYFTICFIWTNTVATHEGAEYNKANGAFLKIADSINSYVDVHGQFPASLKILNLGQSNIDLDGFSYSTSNGVCVIRFRGKHVDFFHALDYSSRIHKSELDTPTNSARDANKK